MAIRPFFTAISAVALSAFVAGCEDRPPVPERPSQPELPPKLQFSDAEVVAADLDAGPSDAGAAAKELVAGLRSAKLDIAPRRVPTQKLAFGKDRLAQLTDSELVLRSTTDMRETFRLPVSQGRRVASLQDGSVLVATASEVWHVPRDTKKAQRYGRIPLFPDSLLMGDRRDKKKIWVHHGIDPTLYPYELGDSGRLETLDFIQLEAADQRGFALLKDGSYVYTRGANLDRFFPGGNHTSLVLPAGADVWRVLTTHRLDQLWLARADGKLELCELGKDKLAVQKTLALPGAFDIDTNDSVIAVLRLEAAKPVAEPPADAGPPPRSWRLSVLDADGKELTSIELPLEGVTTGEDWVREISKDRGVALSAAQPIVAVGGPSWLGVWNYKTGERVTLP